MRAPRRSFLDQAVRGAGSAALLAGVGSGLGCASFTGRVAQRLFGHGRPGVPGLGTRSYVQRQLDGLNMTRLWDNHCHVFGDGRSGTGCWINPLYTESFPERLLVDIYLAAGGAPDNDDAENVAFERLVYMQRLANPSGKLVLLAFDWVYNEQGQKVEKSSSFYTPNDHVAARAAQHPDVLRWGASVHPYRADALDALDEAYAKGAMLVKWLPNTQQMDPSSSKCDRYYQKMADLGLPLLVHAGHEDAADSVGGNQSFGNPLHLRRPLDQGVRIIVAHCAGLGEVADLDVETGSAPNMKAFDAFRRLLGEKQYEGRLYADISAMTQFNRSGEPLRQTLLDESLHDRLVYGSDYPLPAIRWLISTDLLARRGYLTAYDVEQCDRIFQVNPVLFDLVLKRSLRLEEEGKVHRFQNVVFDTQRVFDHMPIVRG